MRYTDIYSAVKPLYYVSVFFGLSPVSWFNVKQRGYIHAGRGVIKLFWTDSLNLAVSSHVSQYVFVASEITYHYSNCRVCNLSYSSVFVLHYHYVCRTDSQQIKVTATPLQNIASVSRADKKNHRALYVQEHEITHHFEIGACVYDRCHFVRA
jgi:uncharacterized paraquat-inducible protein A